MTPKQLLEAVTELSKQQLISFLKRTLRLVSFNQDDITDLETLIVEIEDQIEEIKVLGDDPNFPHPYRTHLRSFIMVNNPPTAL